MSEDVKRCPMCHQPITKGPSKVCLDCGKPIERRHKFYFTPRGLRHRDCSDPTRGVVGEKRVEQTELIEGLAGV